MLIVIHGHEEDFFQPVKINSHLLLLLCTFILFPIILRAQKRNRTALTSIGRRKAAKFNFCLKYF